MKDYLNQDTVVAISTPIGVGAIGIVRLSGSQSQTIVRKIFQGSLKPKQINLGWLVDGTNKIDQVVVLSFEAPNSYTSEDMVELHCHGSVAVLERVVGLCCDHGARRAEAGEFTKRAYLNGKLSLTQAEAVGELIHAESEQQAKIAANQLAGGLSKQISSIKTALVELAATETASLDFSEEDIEDLSTQDYLGKVQAINNQVNTLLAQRHYLPLVQHGIKVAIVGLPNAGKSTLLNALLGYERSIVTELAGTTRDTIAEYLQYKGIKIELIDTAGLRKAHDRVEQLGVERSHVQIGQADVVLVLIEPNHAKPTLRYIQQTAILDKIDQTRVIVVLTKSDIANQSLPAELTNYQSVAISAQAKTNLQVLLDSIYNQVITDPAKLDIQVITERQFGVLQTLSKNLQKLTKGIKQSQPRDVLLLELQACVESISELDGSSASEAVIAEIFRNFCIGK